MARTVMRGVSIKRNNCPRSRSASYYSHMSNYCLYFSTHKKKPQASKELFTILSESFQLELGGWTSFFVLCFKILVITWGQYLKLMTQELV